VSLVLIYDKCKQHAEKVYKTFYFLKISGNLRLLDYYGGCAPVHVYGLRNLRWIKMCVIQIKSCSRLFAVT